MPTGVVEVSDEVMSIADVAKFLGMSPNYLYKKWTSWRKYGVRVLKIGPNAAPRFYKSDIIKMLEKQK